MTELRQTLQRANYSATGLDQVHYQLLTHLPNSALSVLLKAYNHVWESGCFPPSWREEIVIPIPKPGKDHLDPSNFRPIALTSCLCKTMERMINARLMWSLESQGLLSEKQRGFRKNHSTLDHLVCFETLIRNAFVKKEHVLTIFFDIEKAYDTTWKHGILADLWNLGFRGHLSRFIQIFLSERSFRVRVGSTLSELHDQKMGVPQGSILSPALFSIKINNIVKAVLKGTGCSLFVDDFALCVSGKTLNRVDRAMQLCVNSVQKWVAENGFKFSNSKTVCIHFHPQYGFFPEPNILLGKTPIRVVRETKKIGVIFDRKLTFKNHIQYLKNSCQRALDILRVVGHTDWGADRIVLLRLYRLLVRSKLDYGCIVYGSARRSILKQLDPIHHQGLRIALGAFRTSPAQSLYIEAHEPSLTTRRLKLSLNYVLKLTSLPENTAYSCVFEPQNTKLFEESESKVPPLGIRILPHLEKYKLNLNLVDDAPSLDIVTWKLSVPAVRFDLASF